MKHYTVWITRKESLCNKMDFFLVNQKKGIFFMKNFM